MTINSDVVTVQPEIGEVASNKANIVFYIKDGTSSDKLSWCRSLKFHQVLRFIMVMQLM